MRPFLRSDLTALYGGGIAHGLQYGKGASESPALSQFIFGGVKSLKICPGLIALSPLPGALEYLPALNEGERVKKLLLDQHVFAPILLTQIRARQ